MVDLEKRKQPHGSTERTSTPHTEAWDGTWKPLSPEYHPGSLALILTWAKTDNNWLPFDTWRVELQSVVTILLKRYNKTHFPLQSWNLHLHTHVF